MKRDFNLIFILNIIIGMFLFAMFFWTDGFSLKSIILCLVLCIYYIIIAKIYSNKKFKRVEKIDYFVISICIIFMMFLFSYGVFLQIFNSEIYCLLYYDIVLLVIHFLFTFYYLFR